MGKVEVWVDRKPLFADRGGERLTVLTPETNLDLMLKTLLFTPLGFLIHEELGKSTMRTNPALSPCIRYRFAVKFLWGIERRS